MFYEQTRQAVVSSFFLCSIYSGSVSVRQRVFFVHSVVVLISSRCFAMVIDASSFTVEVFI